MASSCASETGVSVEGFGYAWPGAARASLLDVDLALRPGECVWLSGPTGSGKSTLLRALARALPAGGRERGRIRTPGRPALLLQNVDTQLLCTTVEEEVAFGLMQRRVPQPERAARVREALDRVGLAVLARRAVDALSAGQKQRAVLAALLALRPRVLLLDEPTSALDPDGRRRLASLLGELKRRGHALLVADHAPGAVAALADRRVALKEGGLAPLAAGDVEVRPVRPAPVAAPEGAERLRCDALALADADGRALLDGLSLRLSAGERLLVTGANGAGKTTLLRAAAGLLAPTRGRVERAPGAVGLLFQNPQRNLFERTVAEEVAFALRRQGLARAAVEARVGEVLDLCELGPMRDASPLRLSFGEQHRVALAAVLAPRPPLLLLDEPFAGLDPAARERLLDVVAREQRRAASAVVIASHDDEGPAATWCGRTLRLTPRGGSRHG